MHCVCCINKHVPCVTEKVLSELVSVMIVGYLELCLSHNIVFHYVVLCVVKWCGLLICSNVLIGLVCRFLQKDSVIFPPTNGGGEKMAADFAVPFLGRIPLDPYIGIQYCVLFPHVTVL